MKLKLKPIAAAVLVATFSTYGHISTAATSSAPSGDIQLSVAGTYATGIFDEGAAEIAAYDRRRKLLFVTNSNANTLDVIRIRNIYKPRLRNTIDLSPYGAGVNSVAVKDGIVAVAVEADPKQDPGSVVFFDIRGVFLSQVQVGALPDMVAFTPDGSKVLVANEGEPNDDYTVDPEGSVSVIDMTPGAANLSNGDVTEVNFQAFNGQDLSPVRIFGPGATVAQDLEPEYITVSTDSATAWVSLQENNAIAIIDIAAAAVTDIVPLGTKTFDGANKIDASDRDDAINIASWPVVGMYQPDAIAAYENPPLR